MRSRRKVTMQPIGTPSRSLKFAIAFFARVTTGFCPVIGGDLGNRRVDDLDILRRFTQADVNGDFIVNRGTCMEFL